MKSNIYVNNKPLVNSFLTGLFYLLFCWSLDWSDATQGLFMGLMLFLPGITFPITTSYFDIEDKTSKLGIILLHIVLSIAIYHTSVWLFSGEGRIKNITIIAGFCGSLLFLLATKMILKKDLAMMQIFIASLLSGLAFLPYELVARSGLLNGIAVFLWTITNGLVINIAYRRSIIYFTI